MNNVFGLISRFDKIGLERSRDVRLSSRSVDKILRKYGPGVCASNLDSPKSVFRSMNICYGARPLERAKLACNPGAIIRVFRTIWVKRFANVKLLNSPLSF